MNVLNLPLSEVSRHLLLMAQFQYRWIHHVIQEAVEVLELSEFIAVSSQDKVTLLLDDDRLQFYADHVASALHHEKDRVTYVGVDQQYMHNFDGLFSFERFAGRSVKLLWGWVNNSVQAERGCENPGSFKDYYFSLVNVLYSEDVEGYERYVGNVYSQFMGVEAFREKRIIAEKISEQYLPLKNLHDRTNNPSRILQESRNAYDNSHKLAKLLSCYDVEKVFPGHIGFESIRV